jgi:hypothetical protein
LVIDNVPGRHFASISPIAGVSFMATGFATSMIARHSRRDQTDHLS